MWAPLRAVAVWHCQREMRVLADSLEMSYLIQETVMLRQGGTCSVCLGFWHILHAKFGSRRRSHSPQLLCYTCNIYVAFVVLPAGSRIARRPRLRGLEQCSQLQLKLLYDDAR